MPGLHRRPRPGRPAPALRGDRAGGLRAAAPARRPPTGSTASDPGNPASARTRSSNHRPAAGIDPTALWRNCTDATKTPAHAYLTKRLVWPPAGSDFLPLPAAVRWLRAAAAPRALGLPPSAAGAVAFRYDTDDRQAVAVSLEALTADGERLRERWRRTHGVRKGARFAVGAQRERLIVCEGEVSALACRWLYPGATVWALGGTAGLSAFAPPAAWQSIVVETDGDPAGNDAGRPPW